MKNLILVFAAIAISAGAYAQADSTTVEMSPRDMSHYQNQDQNLQHHSVDKSNPDGVMMQNGKMMKVKNGKMTIMEEKDMTLSNGTKIMSDGTCINKDGSKMTLKEGQRLDMSGKMVPMKYDKDQSMHLDTMKYDKDQSMHLDPMDSDKDKSMHLDPDSTGRKR